MLYRLNVRLELINLHFMRTGRHSFVAMKAFPCYRSSGSRHLAVRRLAVKLTVHDVGYQTFGCRIHKNDIKCLRTIFSQVSYTGHRQYTEFITSFLVERKYEGNYVFCFWN